MITFSKMHGLGNDYICINCLGSNYRMIKDKIGEVVRYLCNRHFGVGADGVILVKESKIADIRMQIYNADGTEAEMCGNGIRCFAKYVQKYQIFNRDEMLVETKSGIRKVRCGLPFDEIEVDMGKPKLNDSENIKEGKETGGGKIVKLKIQGKEMIGYGISMGNPHIIFFVDNVEKVDVKKYGSLIENLEIFPNHINVEFVQILGRKTIKLRVWERGVGETYACGTGACAAVVAGYLNNFCDAEVTVLLKGGELKISYEEKSKHVKMKGIANYVFEGKIEV